MTKVFGRQYTKRELLAKIGDISQLCGIKVSQLTDGTAAGTQIAHGWTGGGLEFEVDIGRGMGIGAFRYRGIPLAWISATGEVHSAYYDSFEGQMDRSYYGGLMHMCGFRQVGAPNVDGTETLGMHGRASNLPAKNIYVDGEWSGEEYQIWAQGKIQEVSALGENICMTRKVSAKLGENRITIQDKIQNQAHRSTEFMVLYHTNFGFPLLDEGTKLYLPSLQSLHSEDGTVVDSSVYGQFAAAHLGAGQQIYFHQLAHQNGKTGFVIYHPDLQNGLGILVEYDRTHLPNIIEWVDLEAGQNVLEVGPSNCKCFGRAAERAAGTLDFLEPGEIREYEISFTVLDGCEPIQQALHSLKSLL